MTPPEKETHFSCKTLKSGDGKFALNSRYKIDIGEDEPIEVNKVKLYKFDRSGTKKKQSNDQATKSAHEAEVDDLMSLVSYEGPEPETGGSRQDTTPRTAPTLEEAKKEVAEALKEIWQLPESERSSAIKRLIRQWHPDKNKDREVFANEITQFLLNEVERLKKGGIPGYHPETDSSDRSSSRPSRPRSTWDGPDFSNFFNFYRRRARQQRQRYNEWRDNSENETEPANKQEAERWMRQANEDLHAANYLFRGSYYSLTCFICEQAVEKALKAFMFANGCLEKNDLEEHDVLTLAYRASELDPRFRDIPMMVRDINGFYAKTRYPEYRRGLFQNSIPAEMYTQVDADDALSKAKQVLELLRQVIA